MYITYSVQACCPKVDTQTTTLPILPLFSSILRTGYCVIHHLVSFRLIPAASPDSSCEVPTNGDCNQSFVWLELIFYGLYLRKHFASYKPFSCHIFSHSDIE